MAWSPGPTCATCSHASTAIPANTSTSCCRTAGDRTSLELTVTSPGPYSVVWLESDRAIPPPDADLDLDLLRAGQAGAIHHLDELMVAP